MPDILFVRTLRIVIFTLFYSLLDLRSSECNVVSLYVVCCSVNVSVCFVCCVLDSVCELFGETIRNVRGCSCYFVVEWMCLVCVVVLCWIDHVWSSKECVCCACDPNERLSAPSICFVCVFVCRKLSPHLGV